MEEDLIIKDLEEILSGLKPKKKEKLIGIILDIAKKASELSKDEAYALNIYTRIQHEYFSFNERFTKGDFESSKERYESAKKETAVFFDYLENLSQNQHL